MKRLAWLALCGLTAQAVYTYYFTSSLGQADPTNWYENGAGATYGSNGFTASSAAGAALISKVAVPDGSQQYEARATLRLTQSGGNFVLYLHASNDALHGSSPAGTYYAWELRDVTFNGAACTAMVAGYKRVNGVLTQFANQPVVCRDGMTLRAVYTPQNNLLLYVDDRYLGWSSGTDIPTGKPGVGVSNAAAGNSVKDVKLGPADRAAPAPINAGGIGVTAFPNRVEIQWQGTSDGANGTGVAYYRVWRGGSLLNESQLGRFADSTVVPGQTYNYAISAVDFHQNETQQTAFQATTPPANVLDPRQVGVRTLSSYYGAAGEQIDTMSGNLNFSVPILKAMGRGGWGVGFALNYNSQNWRKDPAGEWLLGSDIGYGFGWRLQAGSITPVWSDRWTINHWLFTDSTGAEYRLTENSGGVWRGKEGLYVWWDSNLGRLYFKDGSYWYFGCESWGGEADTGTRYPTLMQDANGNQVFIKYKNGVASPWEDSSGRIDWIRDVRATGTGDARRTYNFTWNTDPLPHLTQVTNTISSPERASFIYGTQTLTSPFNGVNFGATTVLARVELPAMGDLSTKFEYNGAAEMTKMTTPHNGYLRWTYRSYTLAGSKQVREVEYRYLSKQLNAAETTVQITRDANDINQTFHLYGKFNDLATNTAKQYYHFQDMAYPGKGLPWAYCELDSAGNRRHSYSYGWAYQATSGQPYLWDLTEYFDQSMASQISRRTEQEVDQYGNVTVIRQYPWNSGTVARTYTNTYKTGSNYVSRYIRGLLESTTLAAPGQQTLTLVTNNYDQTALTDITNPAPEEHNPAYGTSFVYRGNLTSSTSLAGITTTTAYDITGAARSASDGSGYPVTVTTDSATNFAAPKVVAQQELDTTFTYNPYLALATKKGANGEQLSITYDSMGRPATATSPYGAQTVYSYTWSPTTVKETTGGHWVRKTLDGFGRPILIETGQGSTVVSNVEMEYAPCACSPLGKLWRQSMPYAPGGTKYWTTWTYDSLGRTLTETAPDGSVTSYSYYQNTVTVTDAAGKWKKSVTDAFGNLTQVEEPPATGSGASVFTNYTYDQLNHLTGVSMTRGSTTQTRTFNYVKPNGQVGVFLLSETHPETGTTTFVYNANGTLASKTDAKGQTLNFVYDGYKRVTEVRYGSTAQRIYSYDTCPADAPPNTCAYSVGRPVKVEMTAWAEGVTVKEFFSYHQAGAIKNKTLRYLKNGKQGDLTASYTWNGEGRLYSQAYPNVWDGSQVVPDVSYTYQFDAMGRPSGMVDASWTPVVSGVQYGVAGELLAMSWMGRYEEVRTYNTRLQLTQITAKDYGTTISRATYNFPAAPGNNGRIASESRYNFVPYENETINYSYDNWNRLTYATGSGWTQSFTYDGFGNLTAKVGTGSAPSGSYPVNASNNRLTGETYDANGNIVRAGWAYDYENRLMWGGGKYFLYDSSNRKVWEKDPVTGYETITFYGVDGKRMATYGPVERPSDWVFARGQLHAYFAGKRLAVEDRLGSSGNGRYFYPYGDPRNGGGPSAEFATYPQDTTLGLQYAINRWYLPGQGRFTTADPYRASGGPAEPKSWNRYSYVHSDPIGNLDPEGLYLYIAPYQPPPPVAQPEARQGSSFSRDAFGADWDAFEIQQDADHTSGDTIALDPYYWHREVAQGAISQTAWLLRANADCAGLFSPNIDPSSALEQATVYVSSSEIKPGIGDYVGAFHSAGAIFLLANRYFFTNMLHNGKDATSTVDFAGLTVAEMQQAILIHELLHLTGAAGADVPGPDGKAPVLTLPNGDVVVGSTGISLAVKAHCFGK